MDISPHPSSATHLGQVTGYVACYICFLCLKVDHTSQSPCRDVIRLNLPVCKAFCNPWLTEWNWNAVHMCQIFLLSYSNWGQIFLVPAPLLWDNWLLSQVLMGHTEDKADKMQAGKQTVTPMLQKNNTEPSSKIRISVNKRRT